MTNNVTTRSRSSHVWSESDRFTLPEANAPHFLKAGRLIRVMQNSKGTRKHCKTTAREEDKVGA
ncbi:hypothetical protein LguiA_017414 [Lonicera macranthoides]